ncbi:MAG: HNH endonuclease, partial [Acidobacteria bacterium]|nr:HNH endonuclease [Acidobacteriota bacterium]
MPFPSNEVDGLLVACHRHCCICHRFCGVKMEMDHIVPSGNDGTDAIENAIPVCFECHAEIHSYNDKHPRGRKFHPEELRKHKEQWLQICKDRPEILITATRNADVGPLQALIDELDFNSTVAQYSSERDQGCLFYHDQFKRAIAEGAIAVLNEELKKTILEAYVAIGRANEHIGG